MGRYITPDEVQARYPLVDRRSDAEVSSVHIMYAEARVEELLGQHFTAPFSSNNLTVKDLCIDFTYLSVGNFKIKERNEYEDRLIKRVESIIDGSRAMVTTSGDILQSTGDTIYSTTADYTPTFGFSATEDSVVDSDLLQDEEDDRDDE